MYYNVMFTCVSHIGNCRSINQDNFICVNQYMSSDVCGMNGSLCGLVSSKNAPLFGVFDGMGGEEKGEVAAFLAAETAAGIEISKYPFDALREYCKKANDVICRYAVEHAIQSMGTTAAIISFTETGIYFCNIGDSRIFRFEGQDLEQISQDHVMPSIYGIKTPLSQNLGIPAEEMILEPYLGEEKIKDGNVYLICSDGLTDMLTAEEIEETLRTAAFDTVSDQLLEKALERGGKDNITLILCRVEQESGTVSKAQMKRKYRRGNTMTTMEINKLRQVRPKWHINKKKSEESYNDTDQTEYQNCSRKEEGEISGGKKPRRFKILAAVLALVLIIGTGIFGVLFLNSPKEISINANLGKNSYDFGETLQTDGLSLEVVYNSGRREIIQDGFTCSPTELLQAGEQDITVTYRGKSTTYSIEVVPVLTEIAIKSRPEKTTYKIGDKLETEGLELEAKYNDGSTKIVRDGFTCSLTELLQVGKQNINVTYEGKTAEFFVNVMEITAISVQKEPNTTVYMAGDTLNTDGLVLTVSFSNGSKENILNGFSCSPMELSEAGTQDITVSYAGKSTAFTVDVLETVAFEDLEVVCNAWCSRETGEGYNSKGVPINRSLWFSFNLPEGTERSLSPTITCSWGHVMNGEGSWEGEANIDSAKNGITYCEFGTTSAEYSANGHYRYTYMLFLPDDPSVAGEQSVTMKVGNSQKTVSFKLIYAGNYDTGTGWKVTNVKK